MRRLPLTFVSFLVAVSLSAQQNFDKLAADTMTAWHFPGLAIAVVQNDRVFGPLGMTNTRTRSADWAPSDHATGHDWSHDQAVVHPAADDTNVGPAGSIKSSAHDMAQWLRFQLANGVIDTRRLVSEDALNETKTPQMALRVDKAARETNPFVHVQSYAMGWIVQDYRGELLISHGGALNGFRTQVALLPDRNAAVVILVNMGRGFGVTALRNGILDELLHATPSRDWNAAYLAAEKKAGDRTEQTKKDREAKRVPNSKPSRDLAAYAGTYHDAAYGDAVVALENGGARASLEPHGDSAQSLQLRHVPGNLRTRRHR